MKRFYKVVSIEPHQGAYALALDGRMIKTPLGCVLSVKTKALAHALQAEWAAQVNKIVPSLMPLTQIASTQIDQVAHQRAAMSIVILKYLDTDLLCYRAGEIPPGMQEAQKTAWDPWLNWFQERFGSALQTTTDLRALNQSQSAHNAIKTFIESLSAEYFTVLQIIVPMSGSIVLGLAFIEQALSPQDVYNAARVEENFRAKIYNEEFYGPDPAQSKKDSAFISDLIAAEKFLKLLGQN